MGSRWRRAVAGRRHELGRFWRAVDVHLTDDANLRFLELGTSSRLIAGVVGLLAVPLLTTIDASDRLVLVFLIGAVFLPYAYAVRRVGADLRRTRDRMILATGDLLVLFLLAVVAPETRTVVLFGCVLVVTFHTFVAGFENGLVVAGGAMLLAIGAELVGTSVHGAWTIVMFALVLILIARVVSAATEERRRSSRFLSRLQDAISAVSYLPGLEETLDSVCSVACGAVEAKFASVLVRDQEGFVQGALEGDLTGTEGPDPKQRSRQIIERILADPHSSPSGLAFVTGERVVVEEVSLDPRFAHWSDEAARQRFTSTIAVPLRTGEDVIGVLAAYFPHPSLASRETADLLTAYADHVTLVILRALAFEHERRAAGRLAEADRLKSDLVGTVSHELRTPLTSVKGFVETLLRYWDRLDDDERRNLLRRVQKNADTLAQLVDNVLDYSRLEAEAVAIELETCSLATEIHRFVDSAEPLLADHEVVIDVPPDLGVRMDSVAFEHVLSNLVSNAVKYSPAGSRVTIRARRDDAKVVVSVADQGPGIPEELRERIFERFYRGDSRPELRGSGIGLAVVSRYVELLGGRVWVESEPGDGSVFSFTLPIDAEEAEDPRDAENLQETENAETSAVGLEGPGSAVSGPQAVSDRRVPPGGR